MCPWPLSSGKSGQQVVDVLQKNVELAGAQWSGSWCVDCETYQSASGMGKGHRQGRRDEGQVGKFPPRPHCLKVPHNHFNGNLSIITLLKVAAILIAFVLRANFLLCPPPSAALLVFNTAYTQTSYY